MIRKLIYRHKSTLLYGAALALLLLLHRWLEWKLMIVHHAFELYALALAILFTGLGIWVAQKITRPKVNTVIVEKEVYVTRSGDFTLNEQQLERLGLSKRELEVLQLMAEGLSNQEIAERLFLSLNTIKTHISGLFGKLDVRRRTQAVETARNMGIIP